MIEDDAWIRSFLCDVLTDEGYQVMQAADGRTGVRLATDDTPDLVLLDLAMPDCSGLEVLSQFGRQHVTRRLPVLVLTSFTPLLSSLELPNVAGVITKPVDVTQLLVAVSGCLCPRLTLAPDGNA